jgi:hypothetical protein
MGVLYQGAADGITVAATHVTDMRDSGEVILFQGFQHQKIVEFGVTALGRVENLCMMERFRKSLLAQ